MKNPVYFSAWRDANYDNSNNVTDIIKFNEVDANVGNGFNKDSGIFTVPQRGVYHFTFDGRSTWLSGTVTMAFISINDNEILYDTASNPSYNMAFTWAFNLQKNDQVKIRVQDAMYVMYTQRIYFTGQLVHAY